MAPRVTCSSKSPSQDNVLGVDPGLDRTGYAVVEMPSGRLHDAGLIRSTPTASLARRLFEIETGIEDVFAEHSVNLLVVEDLFSHYKHPRTAILMGHARGVVLLVAARHGIEVVSVSATKIKKTLTGNGHASKLQVQRAIMATFGLSAPPEPADVADALAAAHYAVLVRRY
ncbi:MAG: crossover junction endodeoxyribonuclease RuvC [Phycisphaerae bacterium]|nr:crossover junction endodeoxyribonuclease RuvC [Phycisphaerae bacterium]